MSRYSFDDIVTNTENLTHTTDIRGFSLFDWVNNGIIGWDVHMETYFIQLDFDDEVPWWIGLSKNGVPTFNSLCEVINQIFDVEIGFFEFSNVIKRTH